MTSSWHFDVATEMQKIRGGPANPAKAANPSIDDPQDSQLSQALSPKFNFSADVCNSIGGLELMGTTDQVLCFWLTLVRSAGSKEEVFTIIDAFRLRGGWRDQQCSEMSRCYVQRLEAL
jgi:hypothetical protein